jgi:ABC-type nitrate/sulfonate/bicarbonate transport system permease component
MTLRRIATYGPALVLAIALLALWQLYAQIGAQVGQISPNFLPTPTAVVSVLVDNWSIIYVNTVPTLLETVLGLSIATLLGLLLAVLLNISGWVRRADYPLLVISQTIPMVALAPLLLIWIGYDIRSKLIVVILYCFFPIAVACADGLASVEPEMIRLMRSMKASRWQILWMVRLPAAMPSFFSGLRIAATYSVVGAIFGEYVGAEQGLGIYMQRATNSFATAQVFAAIVVTAVLSLALFGLVSLIEHLALPWYHTPQRT